MNSWALWSRSDLNYSARNFRRVSHERALYMWQPTKPLRLADLTSGTALIHGVTNELSSMFPYAVHNNGPQRSPRLLKAYFTARDSTRGFLRELLLTSTERLSPRAKGRQQLVTANIRMR